MANKLSSNLAWLLAQIALFFYTNCNCFSVLGLLNSPFSGLLGKPPGYLPPDSMSMTADFLEKFPGVARMANRLDSCSFLDSRSSSPEDSETSGFSSGSDHLCDMLVRQITFILQLCVGLVEGEYLKPQSTHLLFYCSIQIYRVWLKRWA